MPYKTLILALLLASVIDVDNSYATKPCGRNSYFSNSKLKLSDWVKLSGWAVKVKITKISHNFVPYANCGLKNRDKCAKHDLGNFKATVLKNIKKSFYKKNTEYIFSPDYCAKVPPSSLGTYVIYGFYKEKKNRQIYYNGFHKISLENQRFTPSTAKKRVTISGKVMHISDVTTVPDSPYRKGFVIIIKKQDFLTFLLENGQEKQVRHNSLQFAVIKKNAQKYHKTDIGRDGNYKFNISKGSYYLCLANLSKPPVPDKYPLVISGCTKVKDFLKSTSDVNIGLSLGGVF